MFNEFKEDMNKYQNEDWKILSSEIITIHCTETELNKNNHWRKAKVQ